MNYLVTFEDDGRQIEMTTQAYKDFMAIWYEDGMENLIVKRIKRTKK